MYATWHDTWLLGEAYHHRKLCYRSFLSSLIIHQVKTRKTTSMKKVWIPGLNWRRFWWLYFSVYSLAFALLEKIYQHSSQRSIGYPNTSNFAENSLLRVIFQTLFSVFEYLDNETLSLVFDILLPVSEHFIPCYIGVELRQKKEYLRITFLRKLRTNQSDFAVDARART